ncbi:PRAME family member 33 [Plecturocebus cupreus]
MSLQAPHRLLELAVQSLLRDPYLDTSTLDELSGEVFPMMFMEAFSSRALSCSTEAVSKRQTVEDCPRMGEHEPLMMFIHEPLKVFIDIGLKDSTLDEWLNDICGWIHDRRDLVQLCCSTELLNAHFTFQKIIGNGIPRQYPGVGSPEKVLTE